MHKDALALVLLLGVMILGMIGAVLWVGGSNRRAALAARGRGGARRQRLSRRARALRHDCCGARARASGSSQWLRASGGPLSPVDAVAIVVRRRAAAQLRPDAARAAARRLRSSATCSSCSALRWYVERARNKRRDAFMDQLPDLARMLSNGTQAGLSIAGAVQMAARELDDPAAAEMAAVVQEMRLGQPLDRALERLQERLPSREVAVLMTTIVIQQRAGGDTVRALQELGGTLEARKDLIREIRTVLSGSVFTSYVVAGIGIATIVLMNVFTPGVMREMTSSLPGLLALGVAGTLWAVAFVLIRATTKVDV